VEEMGFSKETVSNIDYPIPHSIWENDFAKKLGLGKTLTVDLKIPESDRLNSQNYLNNNFERMRDCLQNMHENLIRGEGFKVINQARKFYESTPIFKESGSNIEEFKKKF